MMNLEKLGLSSEDMLQRSQLASILGGNGDETLGTDGSCDLTCASWSNGRAIKVTYCSQSVVDFYCQSGGTCNCPIENPEIS
ncbi:hypothetical protein [Belliella pelovolcani]|uniref:hypothetical protein n=1 Tax=Belliella pelovolcani TaxID=529505 RepID=UPI0039197116